jgi:WD40 repeat protein
MLYDQPGSAYDLAVSPDGALLAATLNGAEEGEKGYHGVKAWDLATGKQAWEVAAMEPEFMTAVAFAPDGQALAIGGALSIRVEERGVVGYRSEGRLWCYGTASRQLLWQAADESNGTYNALAFTPDGTGVLTGSSGPIRDYQINGARGQKVTSELRRWDAATGKPVWRTEAELGGMHALAVAPDGGTIAGADHEQVMVFDPASGLMREVLFKRTMTPKPPKK